MPDRSDADQEGITLPPTSITRMIAREAADAAILQHLHLCPLIAEDIVKRVRSLEIRFSFLIGCMFGSGALGGLAGAALTKLMGQ